MNIADEMHLASIAYTEYSRIAGGKSLATGQPLPTWDELPDSIRYAWHGSTFKVIEQTRTMLMSELEYVIGFEEPRV